MIARAGQKGFTLVELLIVIIIIAVLAAIAIPKIKDAPRRAREVAVREHLKLVREAYDKFANDTGRYPMTAADVSASTPPANGYNGGGNIKPINPSDWHGPYISGQAIPPELSGWISFQALNPSNNNHPPGRFWCPRPGNDLNSKPYSSY